MLITVVVVIMAFTILNEAGLINGMSITERIFDMVEQIFGGMDNISSGGAGAGGGTDSENPGGLVIVYGVVIFLIFRWVSKSKKKKREYFRFQCDLHGADPTDYQETLWRG